MLLCLVLVLFWTLKNTIESYQAPGVVAGPLMMDFNNCKAFRRVLSPFCCPGYKIPLFVLKALKAPASTLKWRLMIFYCFRTKGKQPPGWSHHKNRHENRKPQDIGVIVFEPQHLVSGHFLKNFGCVCRLGFSEKYFPRQGGHFIYRKKFFSKKIIFRCVCHF